MTTGFAAAGQPEGLARRRSTDPALLKPLSFAAISDAGQARAD